MAHRIVEFVARPKTFGSIVVGALPVLVFLTAAARPLLGQSGEWSARESAQIREFLENRILVGADEWFRRHDYEVAPGGVRWQTDQEPWTVWFTLNLATFDGAETMKVTVMLAKHRSEANVQRAFDQALRMSPQIQTFRHRGWPARYVGETPLGLSAHSVLLRFEAADAVGGDYAEIALVTTLGEWSIEIGRMPASRARELLLVDTATAFVTAFVRAGVSDEAW
ncbi:MAG: hypothetical protein ACC682_12915 [Gemmatimonadota bacterium]